MEQLQSSIAFEGDSQRGSSIAETEGDKLRVWETLDQIVEAPKDLRRFSQEIVTEKNSLMSSCGISAGYEQAIQHGDHGYEFRHPKKIQETLAALGERLSGAVKSWERSPSVESWKTVNACLIGMGELRLLGAAGIAQSRNLKKQGKIHTVGIQVQQVEAAISMETMHTTEMDSGQGKSRISLPIGAFGRHLLTGEQIHYGVYNEQQRRKDVRNLQKLAPLVGASVAELGDTKETKKEAEDITKLYIQYEAVNSIASLTKDQKEELREKLKLRLEKTLLAHNFEVAADQFHDQEKRSRDASILVGTDKDFIFDYIGKRMVSAWEKGKICAMFDEGDVWVRRGSPYVLENLEISPLESYLPDWIAAVVMDSIASAVYSKEDVDTDNLSEQHLVTRRFMARMRQIAEDGKLPGGADGAVERIIRHFITDLPSDLSQGLDMSRIQPQLMVKQYARQLLRSIARVKKGKHNHEEYVATSFTFGEIVKMEFTWQQSQRLTAGVNYLPEDVQTALLDSDTGARLASHRFMSLLDVMIDAREKICSLKSRGAGSARSTSFYHFLESAYGKGKEALDSGTVKDLDPELLELLGKRSIVIERWVGEPISPPDIRVEEDYRGALARLFELIDDARRTGRPVHLVSDNDFELKELQAILRSRERREEGKNRYRISLVTAETSEPAAQRILAHADKNEIVLSNARGGRFVDRETSERADKAGGLRVIVWGPLSESAVLKQVLDRTKRAGKPGDTAWVVYKHGGHVGLADNIYVRRNESLQTMLRETPVGLTILDDSVIEKIYTEHAREAHINRIHAYTKDHVREQLSRDVFGVEALSTEPNNLYTVATPRYINEWAQKNWGAHMEALADGITISAWPFVRSLHGDIAFVDGMRALASNDAAIKKRIQVFRRNGALTKSLRREYTTLNNARKNYREIQRSTGRKARENENLNGEQSRFFRVSPPPMRLIIDHHRVLHRSVFFFSLDTQEQYYRADVSRWRRSGNVGVQHGFSRVTMNENTNTVDAIHAASWQREYPLVDADLFDATAFDALSLFVRGAIPDISLQLNMDRALRDSRKEDLF